MLNARTYFEQLIRESKSGAPSAICSVCSSNRLVLEAAMEEGRRLGQPVLIEATANQINQFGGYTGMQPADFVAYVRAIAAKVGFGEDMLILGGDHLGPLVWSGEPECEAMAKAEALVSAFAAAGFQKIHLDCSMRLVDDDVNAPLSVHTVAARAARLARCVEAAAAVKPVYVIGSEVPIPGGATEVEDSLAVTSPEDLYAEYDAFRTAFSEQGLEEAWKRVIGIVVQPGVEFGDAQVFRYDRSAAARLTAAARDLPGIVLEGHSTDYQPAACLRAMREDGVGILKVGPALTFAAREAVYALEKIERELLPEEPAGGYSRFEDTLERVMLAAPANWVKHYHGDEATLALMRRYSLSDRSRYYMENAEVRAALQRLLGNLAAVQIPIGMLHQYLPAQADAVVAGVLENTAPALIKDNVCRCLRTYR